MGNGTEKKFRWFAGIFEPTVDFFALLSTQAAKTTEGVEALALWLKNEPGATGQRVRELEREADEMKYSLARKLEDSFVTPIDREDIYELSLSLDEVINSAKDVVRAMEAFDVQAEEHLADMSQVLLEGTRFLKDSIDSMKSDSKLAAQKAQAARKEENKFSKKYRNAMRELFAQDDLKLILKVNEVYKTMMVGANHLDRVGEKVLHVLVKLD